MTQTMADKSRQRILAPDLARGFMLLLIALAHAPLYLVVDGSGSDGEGIVDSVVSVLMVLLVDSRAYPLFAALFGYGLVIMLRRRREIGATTVEMRSMIRRRGRWLIIFGFGMAIVVTPVEILGAYGVASLLVAGLFVTASDKTLRRVIAGLAVAALITVTAMGLSEAAAAPAKADAGELTLDALGYGLGDLITRMVIWLIAIVSNVVFFPVILAMLVGGLAARHGILENPARHDRTLRRIAGIGLPIAVMGGIPLALIRVDVLSADLSWAAHSVQILSGLGGGFAYAALFGLLGSRVSRDARWIRPLTATGRRSLTCYLILEIVNVVLLTQTFVGLGGRVGSAGAALVAIVAWLCAVVVATLLERAGRQGPAETLLRNRMNGRSPSLTACK